MMSRKTGNYGKTDHPKGREGRELGAAFFYAPAIPLEKLIQNIKLMSPVKFRIEFRESTSRQRKKWSKLSVLMID